RPPIRFHEPPASLKATFRVNRHYPAHHHQNGLRTRSQREDPPPMESAAGPLDGVVVLDLSRVLAGPYATMLLADLGATVIKVESPQGDETRTWRPPERDGESTYFQSVNRNKWSIALDLGDPDDAGIIQQLLGRSDVLVENFKPGGLARFGL